MMDIVERVQQILLRPRQAWHEIRDEQTSTRDLFPYVALLGIIPAVAGFIGMSLVGISFLTTRYRAPVLEGFGAAIVSYVLTIVAVFAMGMIIDMLAPYFSSQKDISRALKLAVFSATPSWVAGALLVIPALAPLVTLLSLYGFYLLYLGLPVLMGTPRTKTLPYVIVILVTGIIASLLISSLTTLIFPWGRIGVL